MQMLWFVLDDPDELDAVLEKWREIGVSGVTILQTTGQHRRRQAQRPVGARFAFGMGVGGRYVEMGNYTLMTIVPDEETVCACLKAAEEIVGDLNDPNTGVLASWELSSVKGVPNVLNGSNCDTDTKEGDAQ